MAHPVMWFEVLGTDGDQLRRFYGSLFDWSFDINNPVKYGLVSTGTHGGIPGGIGTVYPGARSWVTFYVETPDVDAALARAQELGGKIVVPRTVKPDVTMGVFEDPEGHVIGLVERQAA